MYVYKNVHLTTTAARGKLTAPRLSPLFDRFPFHRFSPYRGPDLSPLRGGAPRFLPPLQPHLTHAPIPPRQFPTTLSFSASIFFSFIASCAHATGPFIAFISFLLYLRSCFNPLTYPLVSVNQLN